MKKYISAALALILTCGLFASGSNAAGSAAQKDETVYARLSAAGAPESVYVVNHFESANGGSFTDYGNYEKVVNMTDLNPLDGGASGDAAQNGYVKFQTDSSNFYYQGYPADLSLPWLYNLTYSLDGASVTPGELAGKSGKLEINLKAAQNGDPVFVDRHYDRYMQQITVTLDTAKAQNIAAEGATAANAGKNRVLAFTVLPGAEADITISADVTGFEMPGIDITAMPFSMEFTMPDTGGMTDEFSRLADAIAELDSGVGELASGAAQMRDGAAALADGSTEFNSGLALLNNSASGLTDASEQISNALARMARGLSGEGFQMPDMSQMAQLPQGLAQLADGLTQTAGGMRQLNAGYAQAFEALDASIEAVPEGTLGEEDIAALYAAAGMENAARLTQLVDSYTAALTVKGTYAQVREAFAAVSPTLDTLAASVETMTQNVTGMAGRIGEALAALSEGGGTEGLQTLAGGISELASNYTAFHNGLVAYTGGVSEMAAGYAALDGGVTELSGGIGDMTTGINELRDGTARMADETAGMPGMVQDEIDGLMDEYSGLLGEDFEPVSFASTQNTHVSFVQFVFKTAGIEKAVTETPVTDNEEAETLWDRLRNLF